MAITGTTEIWSRGFADTVQTTDETVRYEGMDLPVYVLPATGARVVHLNGIFVQASTVAGQEATAQAQAAEAEAARTKQHKQAADPWKNIAYDPSAAVLPVHPTIQTGLAGTCPPGFSFGHDAAGSPRCYNLAYVTPFTAGGDSPSVAEQDARRADEVRALQVQEPAPITILQPEDVAVLPPASSVVVTESPALPFAPGVGSPLGGGGAGAALPPLGGSSFNASPISGVALPAVLQGVPTWALIGGGAVLLLLLLGGD